MKELPELSELETDPEYAAGYADGMYQAIGMVHAALEQHWITSVNCDKDAGTNYASCSCSEWRGKTWNSVGAAVREWIDHVMETVQ